MNNWRRSFAWALVTAAAGFFVGLNGFLAFAARMADAQNSWMLRELGKGAPDTVGLVPYGTSLFTPFGFVFLTPLGLFSTYLFTSGAIRAIAAWFDDPRGDFILGGLAFAAARVTHAFKRRNARASREQLEGADAPDILRTGVSCGLDADYVVLAARRKPEWDAGTVVMTSADWYRLGTPFDMKTPAGLRTAYPLNKMGIAEVVRRGVHYELPKEKAPRDREIPRGPILKS